MDLLTRNLIDSTSEYTLEISILIIIGILLILAIIVLTIIKKSRDK